jgi:hypothetical protein
MGISSPILINKTAIDTPVLLTETFVSVHNGILYIDNPIAETVQVYSIAGALLYNWPKPEGQARFSVYLPAGTTIIIRGSSGWSKKIIVSWGRRN